MRFLPMTLLALPLLVGCGADADLDGFSGAEDCDDSDPTVHPGAPDIAGDGIDGDCDGVDPTYAFLGDWTMSEIYAEYFSLGALKPEGTSGDLAIGDDLSASLDAELELDDTLLGFELTAPVLLEGSASPIPGPDRFGLVMKGDLFDEKVSTDLLCGIEDEQIVCAGGLKALDITFDLDVTFSR